MWRNIASNFLSVLIVVLLALAGYAAWARQQYTGPGPLMQAICFQVPQGGRFARISEQLAEQGAISSAYIFRTGADYAGRSGQLRYGSYLIEPGASMERIVEQVTEGGASTCGTELNYLIGVNATDMILRRLDPATSRYVEEARFDPAAEAAVPAAFLAAAEEPDVRLNVTVVEGTTVWQVVEALRHVDFLTGEVPEMPAEGSLAPDSYAVRRGDSRAALIAQMATRQEAILAAAWEARAEGLPYASPEEALVMASIVEKETGLSDERRQVASVFVNRLRQGMRLQTDPTVIYGVTEGRGVLGRGLRQSELDRATPWNTYVIAGLPPTPIANPGRAAITATLDPDTTEYIFFVADGTGGHAFARTLAEHNANVARWRQIEAQQSGN